jgi:hypothetical protein
MWDALKLVYIHQALSMHFLGYSKPLSIVKGIDEMPFAVAFCIAKTLPHVKELYPVNVKSTISTHTCTATGRLPQANWLQPRVVAGCLWQGRWRTSGTERRM